MLSVCVEMRGIRTVHIFGTGNKVFVSEMEAGKHLLLIIPFM